MTLSAPRPLASSRCAVAHTAITRRRALQELDRRRADGPGRAVDEDCLPAPELCRPYEPERVGRATLGAGSGLLGDQVRRHGRERAVGGDDHVLGVGPELTPTPKARVEPEHPVPDRKGRDAIARSHDIARELDP